MTAPKRDKEIDKANGAISRWLSMLRWHGGKREDVVQPEEKCGGFVDFVLGMTMIINNYADNGRMSFRSDNSYGLEVVLAV
jgi:hypothetical protein